ncbi:HWE histidine kinase domain-containing protein [Komagataeibacter sp. FNDCR2]|uniref:HWE histidine kinase domain-containing protein n=1 Tax=Komagataeibacter sp. FNDCR2 TaxID=2878682 RepID=UPI001E4D6A05|nr:HWE histidine kinase domain-containing protein [Komagataeibacter sp. FNDCR2]MCE2574343.1 GAF domain-containing protein [Komagataeibacter sp. FNDCR2]
MVASHNMPGSAPMVAEGIQPHGWLLACDGRLERILRWSANAPAQLGVANLTAGMALRDVIGREATHNIRNALATHREAHRRPALVFGQDLPAGGCYDVAIHTAGGEIMLEWEPAVGVERDGAYLSLLRTMIDRIREISEFGQLFRTVVRLFAGVLRYDRVMLYRFATDGSGKVEAEHHGPDLESFLGQHFPASDMPAPARRLYSTNLIRIITDISAPPVPVVSPPGMAPPDLSHTHLRQVAPSHCEYLRGMGVQSSLSVSLMVDGQLWGMIACHHYSARVLNMSERIVARMFGEFLSLQITNLLRTKRLAMTRQTHALIETFLKGAAPVADMPAYLMGHLKEMLIFVQCDGAALWVGGRWTYSGAHPPADAMDSLLELARTHAGTQIWHTSRLSALIPDAARYVAQAAGMMIVPISSQPGDYLLVFRREVVRTLKWGVAPHVSAPATAEDGYFGPRNNIEIWTQQVTHESLPWAAEEMEAATLVRSALIEVMGAYHQLQLRERATADLRQRMLNEELNHRVKNILSVVQSLVSQPLAPDTTADQHVERLRGRIRALALAHDQAVRGEGGGLLHALLDAELAPYRERSFVTCTGPRIWLTGQALSVLALVVHELATNAVKYGALQQPRGRLDLDWAYDPARDEWRITWCETGGPTVTAPSRRGFGSVLILRGFPHELGGTAQVDFRPAGLHVTLNLPARHISMAPATRIGAGADPAPPPVAATEKNVRNADILLVEDQFLIAMEAEQAIEETRIGKVRTVASVYEALKAINARVPDVAILDVNLGGENSISIARALRERGVPFIFATGYADRTLIPTDLHDVPMERKPYCATALAEKICRILS